MNTNLLNKLLTIIIVFTFIIIIILLITIFYKNSDLNSSIKSNNSDNLYFRGNSASINNYDDINIAYAILYKFFNYLYDGDYNKTQELFINTIDKSKFKSISEILSKEDEYYNGVVITYQGKYEENRYIIRYYSKYLGENEMVYILDKPNYAFSIEYDSNLGDK